jgi:DNA-binding NarL/FixJ family response regulator
MLRCAAGRGSTSIWQLPAKAAADRSHDPKRHFVFNETSHRVTTSRLHVIIAGSDRHSIAVRARGRIAMREYFINVVNAAYNLSETDRGAMRSIAQAAANLVPDGPVIVAAYDGTLPPDSTRVWFERAGERDVARFAEWQRLLPPGIRQLVLSLEPRVVRLPGELLPEQQLPAALHALAHQLFPLCILANTGDGRGLHIAFGNPDLSEWRPGRLTSFHEIALHLAAAWRLRMAWNLGPLTPRDALRRAVATQGRDASSSRGNPLWTALVAGQWSLLDSFTTAGTRHVVAHENPPGGEALRALSWREQTALELALAGRSGKWIGSEMRLSESAVARTLRSALRKIGADDAAALSGVRGAQFEPFDGVATGGKLAIARLGPAALAPASLSDAERAIVVGLLGGKRAAAIARERGTSPRTVAHQISSTYQKLGVSSRRELLALFT